MVSVDLNADLGESFGTWQLGDDDAMLGLVTSANVACGFHAGDPATLRHSCEEAARNGVRIGAQVGYRDLAGSAGGSSTSHRTTSLPTSSTRSARCRRSHTSPGLR